VWEALGKVGRVSGLSDLGKSVRGMRQKPTEAVFREGLFRKDWRALV